MNRRLILALVVLPLWMIASAIGLAMLWQHANAPGIAGTPPKQWPIISRLPHASGMSTLVMIVHPKCPCSRASMGELTQLMTHAREHLAANVVFVNPGGFDPDWVHSDLWNLARAIPGVRVSEDDGTEARRFGAATSGQTMLYGADGQLLFSGGITAGRGHFGDNAGLSSLESILHGEPAEFSRTSVFGCALLDRPAPPHCKVR